MIKIGDKQYFTSPNWKLGWFWSGNTKTAIASLRRTKWRSFFTMMGVILGVTSVVTIISFGEGLKHRITGQADRIGNDVLTIRPGKLVDRNAEGQITNVNFLALFNSSTLTDGDVSALKTLPNAQAVVPLDFVTSSAKGDSGSSDNMAVIGTGPELNDILGLKLANGNFFSPNDTPPFAVLGTAAAEKLFDSTNPFAHSVSINDSNFIVHGVLKPAAGGLLSIGQTDFNSMVFIPYELARKISDGSTNLQQIFIKFKPGVNVDQAIGVVNRTLLQNHHGHHNFTILKASELRDVSSQVVDSLTSFLTGIAAISLLVGGFGIMDIMLVAVSERTREIGIRKAIGATNRQILNQFLTEGMVLSVMGGLIGLVVAFGINLFLRLYTGLHPIIVWQTVVLAVAVSIVVGVVFSGAPALKAARKLPIDALRGE